MTRFHMSHSIDYWHREKLVRHTNLTNSKHDSGYTLDEHWLWFNGRRRILLRFTKFREPFDEGGSNSYWDHRMLRIKREFRQKR